MDWAVGAPSCRLCKKDVTTEVECSACQEWCCLMCVGHKDASEAEKVRVMCAECSGLQERLKALFAKTSLTPKKPLRKIDVTTPERHVTGVKNYDKKPFVILLRRKLY